MKPHIKLAVTATALSVLVNSYYVFANYYAVSSNGSDIHLWISALFFIFALVCLLIFPFSLFTALFKKYRTSAINVFIVTFIFFISAFICIRIGGSVRDNAFYKLADRSQPLISAIEEYENKNGTPPNTLLDLVPTYLLKIPSTKMGAYPKYEYYKGKEALEYDGNPWVIVIQTPSGGINWDMFMYFPLQNYPMRGYGGSLETINNWAYVHE